MDGNSIITARTSILICSYRLRDSLQNGQPEVPLIDGLGCEDAEVLEECLPREGHV